jgi:hypothetical protein
MGKSTVELPEIAESPAQQGTAGTDDLLAQLAGQEIDRLLAEADLDRTSSPPVVSAATPLLAIQEASPPEPTTLPPSELPPAEVHEKLLPDLDAPRAESAIGELIGPLDPELEEATRETSASAERLGLDLALGPAAAELAADDAKDGFDNAPASLPAIFRPLEWLESCCDAVPEQFLELAGKIGILTMVNAIAVLLYVLFFRHR